MHRGSLPSPRSADGPDFVTGFIANVNADVSAGTVAAIIDALADSLADDGPGSVAECITNVGSYYFTIALCSTDSKKPIFDHKIA